MILAIDCGNTHVAFGCVESGEVTGEVFRIATDPTETEVMFDTLLGDNLPARKKFIAEHGSEYMKDADI